LFFYFSISFHFRFHSSNQISAALFLRFLVLCFFCCASSRFDSGVPFDLPSIQIHFVWLDFPVMGSYRTKEDDVAKISTSIFVTNFPDSTSAKDLFNSCKTYGHVVDSFIPTKRTKYGKRFGFVRFINVFNVDRLVGNLCTVWIGRHKLFANVARFKRNSFNGSFDKDKSKGGLRVNTTNPPNHSSRPGTTTTSFASAVKGVMSPPLSASPALVLDDTCVVKRDLGNFVMGEVKNFSSINNIHILLANEGFPNAKVVYLGGMWVMLELPSLSSKDNIMKHVGVASWFHCLTNAQPEFVSRERIVWVDIEGVPLHVWSCNTFTKIGSKWGEVLELEENKDDFFARKRVCIKTKQEDNILEKFKIIVNRKVFVIRAKELFAWSPSFVEVPEMGYCSEDVFVQGEGVKQTELGQKMNSEEESDIEVVSDTYFGETIEKDGDNVADSVHQSAEKETSIDPFNIYELLNKQKKDAKVNGSDSSCSSRILENSQKVDDHLIPVKLGKDQTHKEGGSILEVLEEVIKVGHTMGFSMEGVHKDMEKIIGSQGDQMVFR
ncbi:RNA-directed DNA polymerase, eukaryota, partial [Tanacetum coccineum]